jgi:hypothetical protein
MQESLHGVLLKDLLKRRATGHRRATKFRQYRGDDVFRFLPAHSIACRYGDMGFSTRSSRVGPSSRPLGRRAANTRPTGADTGYHAGAAAPPPPRPGGRPPHRAASPSGPIDSSNITNNMLIAVPASTMMGMIIGIMMTRTLMIITVITITTTTTT